LLLAASPVPCCPAAALFSAELALLRLLGSALPLEPLLDDELGRARRELNTSSSEVEPLLVFSLLRPASPFI
jgi:hypothetical protein